MLTVCVAAVVFLTPAHFGVVSPGVRPCAAAVAPPSVESLAGLRRAFTATQEGLFPYADTLLSTSIKEWETSRQPANEVGALYKTRGGVREQQGRLPDALSDLSKALSLMKTTSGDGAVPAVLELQRTYQMRARVHAALGNVRDQIADLSAAIQLLDEVDTIAATNPFLYTERANARMLMGEYSGAAEDAETAEMEFYETVHATG